MSIKPCRFCGATEEDLAIYDTEYVVNRDSSGLEVCVHCEKCGANGPLEADSDKAIKSWNNGKAGGEVC